MGCRPYGSTGDRLVGAAGAAWAAARVAVGDRAGDRARADVRAMSGDAAAIVAADTLRRQPADAGPQRR